MPLPQHGRGTRRQRSTLPNCRQCSTLGDSQGGGEGDWVSRDEDGFYSLIGAVRRSRPNARPKVVRRQHRRLPATAVDIVPAPSDRPKTAMGKILHRVLRDHLLGQA
jgi:hypothetical protein